MSASRKSWRAITASLWALGSIVISLEANAGSDVQGRADAVTLRAENATMGEVLQALSARFKITYTLPAGVDRVVDGTYLGTLNEVLARILDGNDYVIESSDGQVSLAVLPRRGTAKTDVASVRLRNLNEASTPAPAVVVAQPVAELPSPALQNVPPLATFLSSNGTVGMGGGGP